MPPTRRPNAPPCRATRWPSPSRWPERSAAGWPATPAPIRAASGNWRTGAEHALRRRLDGQRLERLVALGRRAALERAVAVEEHRHVVVGVVAEPLRHAGRRVEPQVLPGPPERIQAGDRLGVVRMQAACPPAFPGRRGVYIVV